jgi:ABC-type lipoprotein export system ATPase subunit
VLLQESITMEASNRQVIPSDETENRLRILAFDISGRLFGDHNIEFPYSKDEVSPSILILAGRNGSGKTTILRMIAGMLELNFDVFRSTPFDLCQLRLSDGHVLSVRSTGDKSHPLLASFGEAEAVLYHKRGEEPDATKIQAIKVFREAALPILKQIDFELLDIHRSIPLRSDTDETDARRAFVRQGHLVEEAVDKPPKLAQRVRRFVREAQLNYRKFFVADELELLPRILERFNAGTKPSTPAELKRRVEEVRVKSLNVKRFGLQTDDDDLIALRDLLERHESDNPHALILVEAYVEMQESRQKARDLISKRLFEFERIMDDFFINKEVRIDVTRGLQISAEGQHLSEIQLSSGEYHFLFMMVSALLCQRSSSIIAIDEPELSLHATWQRKIVDALTRCATGASPLFLFATHSISIAAEYPTSVYQLTAFE